MILLLLICCHLCVSEPWFHYCFLVIFVSEPWFYCCFVVIFCDYWSTRKTYILLKIMECSNQLVH